MRILGVDPGTAIVGYSIVDYEKGKYEIKDYGCIYTHKGRSWQLVCDTGGIYV